MKNVEPAKQGGRKKPFIEGELTALARAVIREGERVRRAKQDWIAFVLDELRPTQGQKQNLSNLPPEIVNSLQRAINDAIDHGGDVEVAFADPAAKGGIGKLVIEKSEVSDGPTPRLKIPILSCTFDANCDNWECRPGPNI